MDQPTNPTSERLSSKLRELAALKLDKKRIEVEQEEMDKQHRRLQAEIIEQMLVEEVRSVRMAGVGLFTLTGTNFLKVRDAAAFAEWATEADLIRDVTINPDADQITITFDVVRDTPEAAEDGTTGEPTITLTNGLVRVEVIKTLLREIVNEMTSNGDNHPPGIEPAVTPWIKFTPKSS